MAYHNMPHRFIIFLISSIILLSLVFGAYTYQNQQDELHAEQQYKIELELKLKSAARAEMQVLFDRYLNNFKSELTGKAKNYKNSRMVLKEILGSHNFETPEYTKENYNLFKSEVAPNLRDQAEGIIQLFQRYAAMLEKETESSGGELQHSFSSKWKEMNNQQIRHYIEFFSKEEQLIQAYEELIEFYYIHSNLFSVDIENGAFLFVREKDKKKEMELRARIKDLKKK